MREVGWTRRVAGRLRRAIVPPLRERVFFLHVPKCGGTSVQAALRAHCRPGEVFLLETHASRRAAELVGRDFHDYRTDLLFYYMSLPSMKLIGGHFQFREELFRAYGDRWLFTTVLRRPVDRWLSNFFYGKHTATDYYRQYGGSDRFAITEELPEFLETEQAARMGRFYVSFLGGGTEGDLDFRVQRAKQNLERFSIVGRLEDPGDLLQRFEKRVGVKLQLGRKRENPLANYQARVSGELRDKVARLCEPDQEIYDHACRLPG